MNTIALFLPFPPTINTYWRHILMPRRGHLASAGDVRAIISKRGREYRDAVSKTLMEQLPGHETIAMPVVVHAWASPPDKRRRDLDNLPKAVFDALTHAGVWVDDNQVKRMTWQWCHIRQAQSEASPGHFYEISPGMLAIEITQLEPKP